MPELYTNDNGNVRQLTELHVNDGGTVRDIQELYVNDGGTVRLIFMAGPPLPTMGGFTSSINAYIINAFFGSPPFVVSRLLSIMGIPNTSYTTTFTNITISSGNSQPTFIGGSATTDAAGSAMIQADAEVTAANPSAAEGTVDVVLTNDTDATDTVTVAGVSWEIAS